ncbi:MAG: hypothetical protein CMN75_14475 [Spirochaeta sp.]|nr:hypothetical protein [Spirochaeta sp.]RPG03943.1 MAG: DUF1624 domain-containing protein [Proteobacteria bacterium TMED72]
MKIEPDSKKESNKAQRSPGRVGRQMGKNHDPTAQRLIAIDWLRGILIILMAVDHASMFFNGNRLPHESMALGPPEQPFAVDQYILRWISHVCAPGFLFLSGISLSLSTQAKRHRGLAPREIDLHLIKRGLLLIALDPLVISLGNAKPIFQVLTAIGISTILMCLLRRSSTLTLVVLASLWFVGSEFLTGLLWNQVHGIGPDVFQVIVAPHTGRFFLFVYPVLPWLSVFTLGVIFSRWTLEQKNLYTEEQGDLTVAGYPMKVLVISGLISLGLFLLIRYFNTYGNMHIYRVDNSWMQWLYMSKYPPSLSFLSSQLGLVSLALAALMWLSTRIQHGQNSLILVLGQVSLFFYVSHWLVLKLFAQTLATKTDNVLYIYVISAAVCIGLYPVCRRVRSFKLNHKGTWADLV